MARYVKTVSENSSFSEKSSGSESVSDRSTPRTDEYIEKRLYVINRSGSGEVMYLELTDDNRDFISYKVKLEHWQQIKDLVDFGVAIIRNSVYIIGGYDKNIAKQTSKVYRYNASELRWSECSPMYGARSKCGVVAMGDNIFISGGENNGGKTTSSCEIYDTTTDTWSKTGMLISPRCNHCCMIYGNDVYCAGGFHGNRNHNNLWVFENYKWCQLDADYPQRLPVSLDRFSTLTVNNTFYFIGGVGCQLSSSCRKTRFFTQNNVFSYCTTISSDEDITEASDMLSPWNYRLPSLIHHRHSAGTVVIGDKIYVIGGSNLETGHPVRMVEYFDLKRRKWEEDFRIRTGDVSNVVCAILRVPKVPVIAKNLSYKLKWVLW